MPRIAEPRGEPPDLSPTVQKCASWDHSESWFTIAEILTFDWTQGGRLTGIIPVFPDGDTYLNDSYVEWMERCGGKKPPNAYCQGRNGTMLTIEQAHELVRRGKPSNGYAMTETPIVRVEWFESAADACPDFLGWLHEFVEPILGHDYATAKTVALDALEAEHGARPDGLGWIAKPTTRPDVARLRSEALDAAALTRIVFGFDS